MFTVIKRMELCWHVATYINFTLKVHKQFKWFKSFTTVISNFLRLADNEWSCENNHDKVRYTFNNNLGFFDTS